LITLRRKQIRTLRVGSHKSEGKGTDKNRQDDVDDLAGIGVTLVDERGAKTER